MISSGLQVVYMGQDWAKQKGESTDSNIEGEKAIRCILFSWFPLRTVGVPTEEPCRICLRFISLNDKEMGHLLTSSWLKSWQQGN